MERWWSTFVWIALTGFCLSLITHVFALANRQPPWGEFAWPLHAGIFVVFVPALLQLTALERRQRASQKDVSARHWLVRFVNNYWRMHRPLMGWPREVWQRCPAWLSALAMLVFVYGLLFMAICFTFNLLPQKAVAGAPTPPIVFSFFSTGWMCFYALSAAIVSTARRDARNSSDAVVG